MSYANGWAALRLEMPDVVPRTEYSAAEYHFPLIRRVTGLDVDEHSPAERKRQARRAFREAWDFGFNWSILVNTQDFGPWQTSMGHAEYAQHGADYSDDIRCPYREPEDVLRFDALDVFGPVDKSRARAAFEAHYRESCADLPDEVNMTGVYTTLMSGMIALFGWDMLLLAAGVDREGFGQVAQRYARWMRGYMEALAESDVPCVMIHDDIVWTGGPFLHPDWYRKYLFPSYRLYFQPLLDSGKTLIYTSDGDYTMFLGDLAACGVGGFVLEPMTDMRQIAERYGRTHAFIGNADTRVLLRGDRADIEAEVRRCMDIGKSCPGFMLAVGNHIPANTPVDSCLWYDEAYRKLRKR